ncbi:SocA family protein [Methylobacterium sp. J-026]|uniref:Panacea domain-containing protein n=1 Tax=Methylobacterium sp. J-026 TaxID=2836624 RepID=UPI001FBB68F6|nr:Panacea domain-containing protein [Methylobacterium sp. J-026]MCJ2135185.1 SocA family protein [Methylobacterium sp. J-026]
MSKDIRFKFSANKSYAAIRLMLSHVQNSDLHTILKSCYFGDIEHLNAFNRPIFGATYRAMKFGPVPLEIYEMTKSDPIWLGELGIDNYPWRLNGFHLEKTSDSIVDTSSMSESDLDCIKIGFEKSRSMTFTARTAATHGKDWQAANLGLMRYEDMLADGPDKSAKVAYLKEAAPHIRL